MVEYPLLLLALIIPLTLDTFVLSSALSLPGLPKKRRLKVSLILAGFEAVMPAVGVLIGRGLGDIVGHYAGYTAAVIIGIAGVILLLPTDKRTKRRRRKKLLARTQGIAIIDLGLSISLDELAIGISLGLLGIPLLLAMALIGTQAFISAQLGLWLGGRLSESLRHRAEQLTGMILLGTACFLVAIKLTTSGELIK
jgi:putative Mn2+ efflux pump MntP